MNSTYLHTHTHRHTHTHTYVCLYVYVCMYVYNINICIQCLYINIFADSYILYHFLSLNTETDALPTMTWYLKVQWVVYNIVTFAALFVTVAYWGLLYKGQ